MMIYSIDSLLFSTFYSHIVEEYSHVFTYNLGTNRL